MVNLKFLDVFILFFSRNFLNQYCRSANFTIQTPHVLVASVFVMFLKFHIFWFRAEEDMDTFSLRPITKDDLEKALRSMKSSKLENMLVG